MPIISTSIVFNDNSFLPTIFSTEQSYVKHIAEAFNVDISQRGNTLLLCGEEKCCQQTTTAFSHMYEQFNFGESLNLFLINQAIHKARHTMTNSKIVLKAKNKNITPANSAQEQYIYALFNKTLIISSGVAGTGKTYLAVLAGMQSLINRDFERLIITRPVIEAGESIGFLPGDMKEKIDPYLRPIYDAMYSCTSLSEVQNLIENKRIEIAPLAYMRGRTLSNAYILLDEAQNTTTRQMFMFLTRLGENSRMVITGDPSQSDLPYGQANGMSEILAILKDVADIEFINFSSHHIIRHPLVAKIVERYTKNKSEINIKRYEKA